MTIRFFRIDIVDSGLYPLPVLTTQSTWITAFGVGHLACVAHYMHKKKSLCAVQHRKNNDVQKVTNVAKNEDFMRRFLLQLRKEKSESAQ